VSAARPGSDADRASTEARIRALRGRTLAVGTVALLAAVAGGVLLLRAVSSAWHASTGVALHVPGSLSGFAPLPWIALALGAVAVGGLSTATIRQRHALLAAVLCAGVAIADVLTCPPERSPLGLAPSGLERMVAAGDRAGAARVLDALPPSTAVEYVRAQVAMIDRDAIALRRIAPRLLDEVERFANRVDEDELARGVLKASVGGLRIDTVAALDRALNGEPVTLAGLSTPEDALGAPRWMRVALGGGAGVLLVALAIALAVVWRTMCGRVERVEALFDGEAPEPA
jgi:hypothetical protein